MSWLPDYGVGMFAMASLTYSGPSAPINRAWDVLLKTGGLQKRELQASPILYRCALAFSISGGLGTTPRQSKSLP